jgi:hypothetical protein
VEAADWFASIGASGEATQAMDRSEAEWTLFGERVLRLIADIARAPRTPDGRLSGFDAFNDRYQRLEQDHVLFREQYRSHYTSYRFLAHEADGWALGQAMHGRFGIEPPSYEDRVNQLDRPTLDGLARIRSGLGLPPKS